MGGPGVKECKFVGFLMGAGGIMLEKGCGIQQGFHAAYFWDMNSMSEETER